MPGFKANAGNLLLIIFLVASSSACAELVRTDAHQQDTGRSQITHNEEIAADFSDRDSVKLPIQVDGQRVFVTDEEGKQTDVAPYTVTFDYSGNMVIFDLDGKIMQPGKFPLVLSDDKAIQSDISQIQQIFNLTVIQVVGSHYHIVSGPNGLRVIPLPPPHP